jgi:tetratricopeptide (TPR) repeat protein
MRRSALPPMLALISSLALGIAAILQPVTAFGDDLADCTQPSDMPRVVAGCTGLLEARTTTHHNVAIAHRNRSSAYAALGDFERAEQDYHRAVALNPDYLKLSRQDLAPANEDRADVRSGRAPY